MKRPTDEQRKEFWERWGFYQECGENYMDSTPYKVWKHPSNICHDFGYGFSPNIPIDLRSLFEWAVPKLDKWNITKPFKTADYVVANVWQGDKYAFADDADPALALFWALWELEGVAKLKKLIKGGK